MNSKQVNETVNKLFSAGKSFPPPSCRKQPWKIPLKFLPG